MRDVLRKRPSPALVISFIALLVAITGTASALPGRNKVKTDDIAANAVRSADIKASNVKSSDIANGTIGNGDLSAGVANETLTSGSRVTMAVGEPAKTLLTNGTFTLKSECADQGGGVVRARILIETTQDNSAFGSRTGDDADVFGPGTGADLREIVVEDDSVASFDNSATEYAAVAPNGASLSGVASSGVLVQGVPCVFVAHGVS